VRRIAAIRVAWQKTATLLNEKRLIRLMDIESREKFQ
jgi:hypothetical protein